MNQPRATTWDDYLSVQAMNASTIVHGFKSMKSLKRAIDGEKPEETTAMRFGQEYHQLILEPDEFRSRCVVMPDFRNHPDNVTGGKTPKPSTRKTAWSDEKERDFRKLHPGKYIVDRKYFDRMLLMLESLQSHKRIAEILKTHASEITVKGTICHTEFKGRVDLLGGTICDLKGTNDVRPHLFGPLACRMHYPEKMAIYRELVAQTTGEVLPVYIAAIETDGDFDRCLIPIREPVLDHAFGRVSRLVLEYESAKASGYWPGVDKGVEEVELYVPSYWMPENEDEYV